MVIHFIKTGVFPYGMAPCEESRALRLVEISGRTAYKSEDKITDDSAKSFVLMLKKHNHLSVLEHSNIVFKIEEDPSSDAAGKSFRAKELQDFLLRTLKDRNVYHRFFPLSEHHGGFAAAGNFRSWMETVDYLKELGSPAGQFLSGCLSRFYPNLFPPEGVPPTGMPGCRVSLMEEGEQLDLLRRAPHSDLPVFVFKFICDRGITHEVVRHRVFSFTQESTRYVNYKNKGMTVILPEELHPFFDDSSGQLNRSDPTADKWYVRIATLFDWYQEDIGRGLRPEIARDILPNLLKSEIFVSGRWSGWKHFVGLRDSRQAHPRIRSIAREVRTYFESLGLSFD